MPATKEEQIKKDAVFEARSCFRSKIPAMNI